MQSQRLCSAILAKIEEQIERTEHLIQLLPAEHLNWQPTPPGAWPVPVLLGHLLDVLAGFCAVLAAAKPEALAHFSELQELAVNQACAPGEAISRMASYRSHIDEGFGVLDDANLGDTIPTAFVKQGEPVLTLLLGNLEHLINHKHELFTYLNRSSTSDRM